jgi:hypothetical protein
VPTWQEIEFDQTFTILKSWFGKEVYVSLDNAGGPSGVAGMRGMLGQPASRATFEDGELFDEDMFEFVLDGPQGEVWFNVWRGGHFKGASYDPQRQHLSIGIGEGGWLVLDVGLANPDDSIAF